MSDEQEFTTVAPVSALPAGTKLAEYVVRSVIGEGGFGIVYLADDTHLDREVAIKEYLPDSLAVRGAGLHVTVRQADKRDLFTRGLRRFVNEAHILAKFRHPALVSVWRYLEANGTAYMVMPFYRGKTLSDMVRDGVRIKSVKDLFSILLPVLDGLALIHSVECYHRDVSSDNILILENGAPILLDFGAARHSEFSGKHRSTVILKPGFAPIEQYGSDDSELVLGPWTDIYALSAVAYHLVSGEMPPVSVARILKDILKPAVSYASPDLPASVLKVIDAGLSVRPLERPQTVIAYRQALLEAAGDFTVSPTLELPIYDSRHPASVPPPVTESNDEVPEKNYVVAPWKFVLVPLFVFAVIGFSVLYGYRKDSDENAPGATSQNLSVMGDEKNASRKSGDSSEPSSDSPPKATEETKIIPAAASRIEGINDEVSAARAINDEVTAFCNKKIIGRYPFDPKATIGVTKNDFVEMFGSSGKMDQLDQYWHSHQPRSKPEDLPREFVDAHIIKAAFFGQAGRGEDPKLRFMIRSLSMDDSITSLSLNFGGKQVQYDGPDSVTWSITWPDVGGDQVRLSLLPRLDSGVNEVTENGLWAFHRLFDKYGQMRKKSHASLVYYVDINIGGRKVVFEIAPSGAYSPFYLPELKNFKCPQAILRG